MKRWMQQYLFGVGSLAVLGTVGIAIALVIGGTQQADVLLYASDHTGNFDLYVHDFERGFVVNLTRHPADDVQPTWSPDGREIAFVSDRSGSNAIYRYTSGVGVRDWIADGAGSLSPQWSPDGESLLYLSQGRPDLIADSRVYGYYVAGTADDTHQRVPRDTNDYNFPAWSPDGQQIAFVIETPFDPEIALINAADGETIARLDGPVMRRSIPAYAPDGTQLAISLQPPDLINQSHLTVIDLTTGNRQRLAQNVIGLVLTLAWSPDGQHIAFDLMVRDSSNGDRRRAVHVVDVASGEARRLVLREGFLGGSAWSPDGTRIAFLSDVRGAVELFVADTDGDNLVQVTRLRRSVTSPAWQPAG